MDLQEAREQLTGALHRMVPEYPFKMEAIYPNVEQVPGTAFFPGGDGVWKEGMDWERADFPDGGVMLLGPDFYSKFDKHATTPFGEARLLGPGHDTLVRMGYYADEIAERTETKWKPLQKEGVWKGVVGFLNQAKVDPHEVFFTNAVMGLKLNSEPNVSLFEYLKECRNRESFLNNCADFLRWQIAFVQPRAILVLGNEAARMLGRAYLLPDLKHFTYTGRQVYENLRLGNHSADVLIVHHPCQPENLRHNRMDGYSLGLASLNSKLQLLGHREAYAH